MPEAVALATTKRKFYKALDSLNSSSQVSLAPSTSESTTIPKTPATAAAAFDEARERAAKRLRHSTSSSSLPYKVTPSPTASTKVNEKSKDPPNFSPWSHETFLARLKTFASVSLWHPKPDAVNEVEWAKRGWVCVDVNTVACKGGCEKRVVVSLNSAKKVTEQQREQVERAEVDGEEDEKETDHAAFEQALVERYQDVIVEGHGQSCLWRKTGCKDDVYHLQVVRPSVWQPELRKRLQSTLAISSAIQNVKINTIPREGQKVSTPERLLEDLPADIVGSASSTIGLGASTSALEVALHGWRGSTESGSELLHCDACFQRIGLWMYQPGYRPAASHSDDHEDGEDPATIDLVDMHREHCPWRNAARQRASGSLKGLNACEIMHRVVSTYARDQRRRSDEHNAPTNNVEADQERDATANATADSEPPAVLSREEVARQDKERESRLRKIKSLFTIKRRSKSVPKAAVK
ncbi:Golgi membrane exchange factor (Ric1p-Rgp1p) subunit [Vermiconidia calcicola]|uniref:Golgi membrane exchange factor (Ric1p-Rgp1p) subunit n=1 Tax=Vermiconidia calcicola TaxID=1690605 RepID=A0ACC3N194_9PEZI|nr:Golgi membrane exchange factor (Ric1p-Rgp1p) subunit [Vermiconidia calcicola]